ncbi:hypothetical protein ACHAXT_000012 [Thalassiosira profunda]
MNDNQNYFVTRSTSRVLAEPGGKSSTGFLFGGSAAANATTVAPATASGCTVKEETTVAAPAEAVETVEATEKTAEETPKAEEEAPVTAAADESGEESALAAAVRIKAKNEGQHFSIFGGVAAEKPASSNAYASSATTNSYNVLTDRSTSRVLRPPGGHSSIKLG